MNAFGSIGVGGSCIRTQRPSPLSLPLVVTVQIILLLCRVG